MAQIEPQMPKIAKLLLSAAKYCTSGDDHGGRGSYNLPLLLILYPCRWSTGTATSAMFTSTAAAFWVIVVCWRCLLFLFLLPFPALLLLLMLENKTLESSQYYLRRPQHNTTALQLTPTMEFIPDRSTADFLDLSLSTFASGS